MSNPKFGEVWLVALPFTDLISTKVRPTLVISVHRENIIILGIFSKIPTTGLRETWVLMPENHPEFLQTGLKKISLIRADKIATVHESVFQKQLGILPSNILILVQKALKKALNIS